jgi:hypothetical protein
MMHGRSWVWVVMLVMGAVDGGAVAQRPGMSVEVLPAASVAGVLSSLASRAGVVFVGQVRSVVPKEGVVEITFQVQQPVIGAVGGTYLLREWAGRWTGGQQRYRVGQRAMYFLHAPSAAGLSSSVGGMAGVVPLIPMGANVGPLLDVRLLAALVTRKVGSPMLDEESGAISLADAATVVTNWKLTTIPEPVKYPLPVGLRPLPVKVLTGESPMGVQSEIPILLQPREQTNAQR